MKPRSFSREPMQGFVFTRKQAASNRTPRQINRNLLFNLIRTQQPISRADLARVSGLQRSTVSLIVEDLIKQRWILEVSVALTPRGRRPTFLSLNDRRVVVALDIHPGQTTVAIADLGGRIVTQNLIELPEETKKVVPAIVAGIRNMIALHKDKSIDGIGICLPGRTDPNMQELIFAPNLKWPLSNLKSKIEEATGLPVVMDNVANACALSEVWFGNSDGTHDLVVVNISEGIGTGIFVNGELLRGADGMAGEFGHIEISADGPRCGCGNFGCWEVMASNRAGIRYYGEITGVASMPSFDQLLKQSQLGDKAAVEALTKMTFNIGKGIRMIVAALAPKEIVVVGDITTVWHHFGRMIEMEVRRNSRAKDLVLRPASDGNVARLRSAVALVVKKGSH